MSLRDVVGRVNIGIVFDALVLYFRPGGHIKRLGVYRDRVSEWVHQCMVSLKGVDIEVVVKWLDCIGASMMARNPRRASFVLLRRLVR